MSDLMPDAMRQTAAGEVRPHMDRCNGYCHEIGDDGCSLCGSFDVALMCEDCVWYAVQDRDTAGEAGDE